MYLKNKTKIAIFGDGKWCHLLLKRALSDKSLEIVFVCGRYKLDNKLLKISKKNKLVFLRPKKVNSKNFFNIISKINTDICISMSYDQIFKKNILNLYKDKIFNCHAGLLPFYRGRNVLNWVLINGEKYYGVSFHAVDKTIDTGDILLQKKIKIEKKWQYKDILKSAIINCSSICYEGIKLIQKGKFKLIKQSSISKKSSYYKKRVKGDEILNIRLNSQKIINFIKALSYPGPFARVRYKKSKILLHSVSSKIVNSQNFSVGEIVKKNRKMFAFFTSDKKLIQVNKWSSDKKIDLKVGDKIT